MFSNLKDFFIENSETNPLYTLFISPPITNQTFNLLKNQFEFSNDLNLYIHNQKLRSVNLETDSSRKKKTWVDSKWHRNLQQKYFCYFKYFSRKKK